MVKARGALATGFGFGLGLMYFLDPERGARRRAGVRDKMAHASNRTGDAMGVVGRDTAHRISGIMAKLRTAWDRRPVEDRILIERARAALGRVVSHPHPVEIRASAGVVTVSGPILRAEVPGLLRAIGRVGGVRRVVNELDEHKEATGIPALQGGSTPPGVLPDILQRNWSPATRVVAGATGTALAGYGASQRRLPGALLAATGLGLFARAATNLEARRLVGIGGTRRAVDVQKTITIDAPIDDVFAFWTCYENFPLFMSRVLDVRASTRERQSHWTVRGPAGAPVEFDAEVTTVVPNEAFGWRTIEGASVAHAGIVRFEPTGDGQTRVHIRMSYNPPGGWLGHGVATVFGVDPKSSFDADLVRMKTLLETGHPPHDAARPDLLNV